MVIHIPSKLLLAKYDEQNCSIIIIILDQTELQNNQIDTSVRHF